MKTKMKWNEKARMAMKQLGITFKDAGGELGISESAVGHQLNARRSVSIKQIRIYAKMLNMSVSELVGDDALFISDENQIKAVEILKEIPEEKRELALKMLEAIKETLV